jgi:transglutaminase-like putative cysteine protease
MQFVSPSRLQRVPGVVWGRTRSAVTGAVVWSAVLVFLLTYAVAGSTTSAGWGVPGIDVVTIVGLSGALLLGVLAVLPVPWAAGLGAGLLLGPVVAAVAAEPTLHALIPSDPVGFGMIAKWWGRIANGSAADQPGFYLYVVCWLMWITGAWLSWCVLRWRRPLLGLIPGAAAFATNLLNAPTDQNGYTLLFLVLTLALLLWSNYTVSVSSAYRAHVKLTGDARWDFWESGLVAMAALIVLAIMLPPLSTVDRTASMEHSAFSSWAQFYQRLSHGDFGRGGAGTGTVGFTTEVLLGNSLSRTRDPVFTYKFTSSDYIGTPYFRGVDISATTLGEWRYQDSPISVKDHLQKNAVVPYAESYLKLAAARFDIKMIAPPNGGADILFYPNQIYSTDRKAIAVETLPPFFLPSDTLTTVDRLQNDPPAVAAGSYTVTIDQSTATEADLQGAGTNYPDWLTPYTSLPDSGYRSPDVLARIRALALKVTHDANATTPYDQAKAIEGYLRGPQFTYDLNTPSPPPGTDPMEYFLFSSKRGYCAYFATAMGDMLRSLGIPTRLVNGFGPGSFDTALNTMVVRNLDAHSWVEVYFPQYGWIPFEPTNDGSYGVIPRGNPGGATLCIRENGCLNPPNIPANPADVPAPIAPLQGQGGSSSGGPASFRFSIPDAGTLTKIAGVLLALLLVLMAAVGRYLRPRTVMTVWTRLLVLSRMAGAERRPGETPLELGRRLAQTFPEASEPVRTLAGGFVVAAYAPPDVAETGRATVMEAWSALRPALLRRIAARLRLIRA